MFGKWGELKKMIAILSEWVDFKLSLFGFS